MVKYLIGKKVDLTKPPNFVTDVDSDPLCAENYRISPFIIQAACHGTIEIFKLLVAAGCTTNEVGHICLSKRRQNAVVSNVIGGAAYYGNIDVLNLIFNKGKNAADMLDVKAIETADRRADKSQFKHELNDFTPLQLAIVSNKPNLQVVKLLLSKEANYLVKVGATQDNVLHLCAKYQSNFPILKYLV